MNLFGAIRVTKAFLPLIRKSKGRVVNVSSVLGRVADPFLGAYSITKFALEAFSDILRFEMMPFNVKVCMIEPGNFLAATNVLSGNEGLNAMANQTWDRLDESIQKDYGKEKFDRQIRISEILMKFSVSIGYNYIFVFFYNSMNHVTYFFVSPFILCDNFNNRKGTADQL